MRNMVQLSSMSGGCLSSTEVGARSQAALTDMHGRSTDWYEVRVSH